MSLVNTMRVMYLLSRTEPRPRGKTEVGLHAYIRICSTAEKLQSNQIAGSQVVVYAMTSYLHMCSALTKAHSLLWFYLVSHLLMTATVIITTLSGLEQIRNYVVQVAMGGTSLP